MNGDQRRRAGGLDVHARPGEIQLERQARTEKVAIVRDVTEVTRLAPQLRMVVVDHVAGDQPAGARVHTDDALVTQWVIAGVFEGFPRDLEEEAMLRVHQPRLGRGVIEEGGVEAGRGFEDWCRFHVVGMAEHVRRNAGDAQLVVGEERDRFDAANQIAPERLGCRGARKPARHADDRDIRRLRPPAPS